MPDPISDSPNAAEQLCGTKYRGVTCGLVSGHHLLPPKCTDGRWEWDYPEHLSPKPVLTGEQVRMTAKHLARAKQSVAVFEGAPKWDEKLAATNLKLLREIESLVASIVSGDTVCVSARTLRIMAEELRRGDLDCFEVADKLDALLTRPATQEDKP